VRRLALVGAAVLATGVLGAGALTMTSASGGAAATGEDTDTTDTTDTTLDPTNPAVGASFDTAVVSRGDLDSEEDFSGTLGFGDEWALPLQLDGIVTAAPPAGTVVAFGSPLVSVDNEQVFLGQGGMPMYRELGLESPRLTGYDVAQLQQFLLSLGFDDDGAMTVDGEFGTTTRAAVRQWQDSLGVDDSGVVTPETLVFHPTTLRLATDLRVGTTFETLEVTAPDAAVTVDASSDDRGWLEQGAAVTVEFADGSTLPGTVTEQLAVSTDDGSTAYRSTIDLDGDVSTDATNVRVVVSTTVAEGVLIVPVAALLAPAEGGYAVEIVDGATTRLVAVEVGAILDGRAEIVGDVTEGDTVVVAG
jgi:peptidoglycan hydrolase-like protein with peptidoglycan-binding domain